MTAFMKNAAIIAFVIGIASLVWGIIKKNHGFKILSIYSFVTTIVFMWYVSHEIVDMINISFITNLYKSIGGIYNFMLLLFPVLGLAVVAEFIVYFVRYYKVNRKK